MSKPDFVIDQRKSINTVVKWLTFGVRFGHAKSLGEHFFDQLQMRTPEKNRRYILDAL